MTGSREYVVAAFDLDGTLSDGGSVFPWLRYVAGASHTYRAALSLLVPLTIGAIRSGAAADGAKERLFKKLLAGRDMDDVAATSREFVLNHLAEHSRPRTIQRVAWHLERGHDVVIVSASPQMYVDVVAEHLGAQGALGTRLAIDPLNKLTGGYLGKNCRGSEKMRRLAQWIDEHHYPEEPIIYAYGNSRGDRKLLRGATYPYNLGRLGWLGALRQFPRLKNEAATADE